MCELSRDAGYNKNKANFTYYHFFYVVKCWMNEMNEIWMNDFHIKNHTNRDPSFGTILYHNSKGNHSA